MARQRWETICCSGRRESSEIGRIQERKEPRTPPVLMEQASKLENIFAGIDDGKKKVLNIVVKADVRAAWRL